MSKIKKLVIIIAVVTVAVIAVCLYFFRQGKQDWPVRFQSELDDFFGKGNWECISDETKESRMYTVHIIGCDPRLDEDRPGDYHNWNISFTNRDGKEEIWTLTDHATKINQSKNEIFSSVRFTEKQGFIQQLMQISFIVAGEEVKQEILQKILSEQEIACLEVDISYRNGNPPPEMYDELITQPWFTAKKVTAAQYLASDLHDFYILIRAHDYRVKKLTENERRHLLDSLGQVEKSLRDTYGKYADYEIYFDETHKAQKNAQE